MTPTISCWGHTLLYSVTYKVYNTINIHVMSDYYIIYTCQRQFYVCSNESKQFCDERNNASH